MTAGSTRRSRVRSWRSSLAPVLLCAALALGACSGDEPDATAGPTTSAGQTVTFPEITTTTVAATTTSTTTLPLPELRDDGTARVVISPTGVVLPIVGAVFDQRLVLTPCGNEIGYADGFPVVDALVVIDAGHGGSERGAVGPSGVEEKAVNLAVAEQLSDALTERGIASILTRTGDYRMTLTARARVATALEARLFVSVHHNAGADGPSEGPGTETYYQIDDENSRRAAGLVYENLLAAFEPLDIAWVADSDAGVKYRLNQRGSDYYGVLRASAGVPAVLVEAGFVSNPPEEAFFASAEGQTTEVAALADGIERYLRTGDPGSGYVEPYERMTPAGSGGGTGGCEDPPLG